MKLSMVNLALMLIVITSYKGMVDGKVPQCTSTIYPKSYERQSPPECYRSDYSEERTSPNDCQNWCNEDNSCRSVLWTVNARGGKSCTKYTISVEDLTNMERSDEIISYTNTEWSPTFTTYDRACGEYPRCTNEYVFRIQKTPHWCYLIDSSNKNVKECKDWCNKDKNCRSVSIGSNGGSTVCSKYKISVGELDDMGRSGQILNRHENIHTYDRHCETTGPAATPGAGPTKTTTSPLACDLSTLIGATTLSLCMPIGSGNEIACRAKDCCFTKLSKEPDAPVSLCIKPNGAREDN